MFKTKDDFLMERNDPIFSTLFSVLQAVHDGKQVTDEGTRASIIDAFHAMSLTENEPSAKDIQTVYDDAAHVLKNPPPAEGKLEWDAYYIGNLADFLEAYLSEHNQEPCYAFNDGNDCICYASESRCNYCKKAVDD